LAPLKVLVIPTDEQLEIAEQTLAVVERHQRGGGPQQSGTDSGATGLRVE
jgi:hypothetical protein